jgi:hypothetical protein
MKFSNKVKFSLLGLLIVLNIVLRYPLTPHEIGWDTFLMHIMSNSLNEFGYAKWILNPLSIVGIYPASYTSALLFFISSIAQLTNIEMDTVIYIYSIFLSILSIFTAYLMAGEIFKDDFFKILVALGFSTSPAIVEYTTWTMPTRNLLLILAPLFIYFLLKCRYSKKYIPLTFIFGLFLFTTHHLTYFLMPIVISFLIIILYLKLKKYIQLIEIPVKGIPFIIVFGFIFMFSIPFFTGRFIEVSRYSPLLIPYTRYIGVLIIPAIAGLGYLILKTEKNIMEWFLLISLISLTMLIFEQTYMKDFIPIIVILFAGIGLMNITKLSKRNKFALTVVSIFLIFSIIFSSFNQFHVGSRDIFNERYIEESTYNTGRWMKQNLNGNSISNNKDFGERIFSASETAHVITSVTMINIIYGFNYIDISKYKPYPISSDNFWFVGYAGPDVAELTWINLHRMIESAQEFNVTNIIENRKIAPDIVIWNHGWESSALLQKAYDENRIYDTGNIDIWKLY